MHDIILIKKLSDKKLFNRLMPYIKEHSVSKETWKFLNTLRNYFKSYPDNDAVIWSEFKVFFFAVSKLKPDEHVIYEAYFKRIEEVDADSEVVEDVLKNYITRDYATQVMNKALNILNETDEGVIEDVETILAQYKKEIGCAVTKDDLFVPASLKSAIAECSSAGFTWRLNELNKSAGPLRIGDFAVVAARPETGKTTFIASELTHFATQLKDDIRPIVWVNNEERSSKVMSRVIQAHFGTTLSDLLDRKSVV